MYSKSPDGFSFLPPGPRDLAEGETRASPARHQTASPQRDEVYLRARFVVPRAVRDNAITGGLSAQDRSTKWRGEKVEKLLYILRGLLKGKPQRLFPRFPKSTGIGASGPCSSVGSSRLSAVRNA